MIRVLDRAVFELVAAGEVVERPASAVKELLENSVDAGASSVTLEIKRGGLGYIRVTDDGCGIPADQVRTAFMSHATSKIRTAEDLEAISTLGFRGEALASIAAVSRTEMMTRARGEEAGTRICLEGGVETEYGPAGCPCGTTTVVRDLFFNLPARLKFMRRDAAEAGAVTAVAERTALSHPEISLRYLRDNREIFRTPGNGKLFSALYAVFGKNFAADMTAVGYELNGVKVNGYVCKPYAAQSTRGMQFFFLNGRWVMSRTFTAALDQAYRNTIASGKFPSCVLSLVMPPAAADVNVHPAKTEVRFVSEQPVFEAVYYAVKSALGSGLVSPEITSAQLGRISEAPEKTVTMPLRAPAEPAPEERRTAPVPQVPRAEPPRRAPSGPQTPPAGPVPTAKPEKPAAEPREPRISGIKPPRDAAAGELRVFGEAFGGYIIAESGDRLYIIDKHAAHERALFEEFSARLGKLESQALLEPFAVPMRGAAYEAAAGALGILRDLGFEASDVGGAFIVRAVPSYIDEGQARELFCELAEQLAAGAGKTAESGMLDALLHTAACKAAVKLGRSCAPEELETLARRVLSDPSVRYCPHGRPVVISVSRGELEKRFGRT